MIQCIELRYLFYSLKAFIPKPFMLQQHSWNGGVKLSNCYSHVKFEKISACYLQRYLPFDKCNLLFVSR